MEDIDENDVFDDGEEILDQGVDTSEKEKTEETVVRVDPAKKRIIRNPQPKLNADRLRGPRGLLVLKDLCKDTRFAGKGCEKKDLDMIMGLLQQWTHRLFPKFTFDDALNRIETLGHKSHVSNYVKRIRLDLVDDDDRGETNENILNTNEEVEMNPDEPFDAILNHATHVNTNKSPERVNQSTLTDEQRERMIRNRLLAEERRMNREKLRAERMANIIQNVDDQSQSTQSQEVQKEVMSTLPQSVMEECDTTDFS